MLTRRLASKLVQVTSSRSLAAVSMLVSRGGGIAAQRQSQQFRAIAKIPFATTRVPLLRSNALPNHAVKSLRLSAHFRACTFVLAGVEGRVVCPSVSHTLIVSTCRPHSAKGGKIVNVSRIQIGCRSLHTSRVLKQQGWEGQTGVIRQIERYTGREFQPEWVVYAIIAINCAVFLLWQNYRCVYFIV